MHKIVRKHWFGLEIYTKNVIFGLNLPHLPKILDTTKNFQKSGLWSSIFMQKIKKLCWVDPEKGSENTRRDRTYLKGPLQQSWGYNSTTNFWYIDNFLTHKITKKLRNHSDQFLRSTTEEEQNKKNCPLWNIKQTSKNMVMTISCVLPYQLQNAPLFQQLFFVTARSFLSVDDKNKEINK